MKAEYKYLKRLIPLAASALFLITGCIDNEVLPVEGTFIIDESALGDAPSPESYRLTFTNVGTAAVSEYHSDGNTLSLSGLVPGIYNVTAQARSIEGSMQYNYIGTATELELTVSGGTLGEVKVSATEASVLIFKEMHYNASRTLPSPTGSTTTYLKDTFFEIYNNSDETLFLDGLCIGDALSYKIFDFTANAWMLDGPLEDYIFIGTYVWQFPGDGDDYPLEPGESCVVAASGINHSEKAQTLDLSTADFETICQKYIEKGSQPDANALNLNLACTIKESALGNQFGNFIGASWVLFAPVAPLRPDGQYIESSAANNYGQEVLKSSVFDAVDLVQNEARDKRLEDILDAGKLWCKTTGGNESIVRKIASTTPDGRNIYQDTNNSSEDFEISDTPQIRRYGARRPSWSTWTTAQ